MSSELKKNLLGAIMLYSALFYMKFKPYSGIAESSQIPIDEDLMAIPIWTFIIFAPLIAMVFSAVFEAGLDIIPGETAKGYTYLLFSFIVFFFVLIEW